MLDGMRRNRHGVLAAYSLVGKSDREHGALLSLPIGGRRRSAVELGQVLDDGQSEPQAVVSSGRRRVRLAEPRGSG
jgi:hypothetical protein